MFRRIFVLLVTAALLGAPTLCTAGLLAHVCACEGEPAGCGHEDDCKDDVCDDDLLIAPREDGGAYENDCVASAGFQVLVPSFSPEIAPAALRLPGRCIPFAVSGALPLLL
jgi:hypothetical protein